MTLLFVFKLDHRCLGDPFSQVPLNLQVDGQYRSQMGRVVTSFLTLLFLANLARNLNLNSKIHIYTGSRFPKYLRAMTPNCPRFYFSPLRAESYGLFNTINLQIKYNTSGNASGKLSINKSSCQNRFYGERNRETQLDPLVGTIISSLAKAQYPVFTPNRSH